MTDDSHQQLEELASASPQSDSRSAPPAEDAADTGARPPPASAGQGTLEGLEELLPEPDPLIGALVGERYRVTELIGRGGMGAVYRAEHIHMRKTVALKVLHREMTAMDEIVARFEREAIAAGRIEHPNVVQARDYGQLPDGHFFLVLEYVEGRVLDRILKDAGETFSVERVLSIAGQIAEALEAAHSQGIVHRDLKPDNIMLVAQGAESEIVKVLDFGIAKISIHEREQSEQPITQAGTVFGTPEYMSPEQAAGQPVDERGDLYSLGLLMYRMLAGHPPFTGTEVQAVLMMQITQPPPALERVIPTQLQSLVFDLLKKDPNQRVQTATEVVARVLSIMDSDLTPSRSRTRAKLASISQIDLPRLSLTERLDAGVFGIPLEIAGQRVPIWRVTSVAMVALAVGVGVVLAVVIAPKAEPGEPTVVQPQAPAAPPAVASELPLETPDLELERLLGRAFGGDKDAVLQLERRSPQERSIREWLALGRGLMKTDRPDEALLAYRTALERKPEVKDDAVLRRDIWNAANVEPTAHLALTLAADHLGAQGADLLYKIWVETKDVTAITQQARELIYREDVRAAASPAVQFLLSWREAIGCDDYSRLLPRAALHADQRSLTLLKRAQLRNECNLPEDSLDAAILAAKDRAQPAPY